MIAHTTLDPESVLLVRDYVNELLSFVSFIVALTLAAADYPVLQADGKGTGSNLPDRIRIC